MRIVWTTAVVCVAACACTSLGGADAGSAVNYGVRLVGPVDDSGRPTHAHVPVGAPFRLRLELFTDGSDGAASVSYDLYLPTDVKVVLAPQRLRNGAVTSSCLRECAVGWDSSRSRRLFVYYALIPPGPAEFTVTARIVGTNHRDTHATDDTGSTTIVSVPARLALGTPELESGAPVQGRTFAMLFPVRRSGTPVRPTGARCLAVVRGRLQQGVAALGQGRVRCAWRIPAGSAGTTLRTTVTATAGSLRASTSWSFAIRAAR